MDPNLIGLFLFLIAASGAALTLWLWNKVFRGRVQMIAWDPRTGLCHVHRVKLRTNEYRYNLEPGTPGPTVVFDQALAAQDRKNGMKTYLFDAVTGLQMAPSQPIPDEEAWMQGEWKQVDGRLITAAHEDASAQQIVRASKPSPYAWLAPHVPTLMILVGLFMVAVLVLFFMVLDKIGKSGVTG